jgi:CRP-like cAMP-binding protein
LNAVENHLIDRLPPKDRKRLLAACEPVRLDEAALLSDLEVPARHVYFPVTAVVSLESVIDGHAGLQVAMVGREGMIGAQFVLGAGRTPMRACVQATGQSHRLPAAVFKRELAVSAALRLGVNRYLLVNLMQLARASACLHFHSIDQRLARWLLMRNDRGEDARFRVTHEQAAAALGARRVGITRAAGQLQRGGLIAYHRGALQLLDRAGLMNVACDCYEADLRAYAAHL